MDLEELFEHGGPVMWPLLAASILGLAVILDRAIIFLWSSQNFKKVVATLRPWITAHAWAKAETWCRRRRSPFAHPFTHLAGVYLQQRDQPKEIREDVLRREGSLFLGHLEKRLRWLAVLAQVSTLLGLLGTFHVMIVRFQEGQATGGQVQPADFSAAIWEALLTTMFGLMIAIPCSAAYQLFEGRIDAVTRQMGILVSYLDEWRRNGEELAARPGSVNGESSRTPEPPKILN
jgi:biopolymer transport protein ExbB